MVNGACLGIRNSESEQMLSQQINEQELLRLVQISLGPVSPLKPRHIVKASENKPKNASMNTLCVREPSGATAWCSYLIGFKYEGACSVSL
jgi:hypothetical protein